MSGRRSLLAAVAFVLAATSCSVELNAQAPPAPAPPAPVPEARPPRPSGGRASRSSLRRFDRCAEFLRHVRTEAVERVEPWGLPGAGGELYTSVPTMGVAAGGGADGPAGGPVEMSAREPQPVSAGSAAFSTTNVQEAGVDEPDIVKTDGERILAIAGRRLYYVEAGKAGRPAGSIDLGPDGQHQLLLSGSRALVLTSAWGSAVWGAEGEGRGEDPRTVVRVLDVSDARMRRLSRTELEGELVSARLTSGVARVVIRSRPSGIRFAHPERNGRRAEREALQKNQRAVGRSSIEDWLPEFSTQDYPSGRSAKGRLVACDAVYRPKDFDGFGTVSVVTIDPERPIPGEAASVLSDAEIVYASAEGLYVATNRWEDRTDGGRSRKAPRVTTQIHRFEIADPRRVVYEASGEIPGHIMSQWSLSEHRGFLRVAATLGEPWEERSESAVHVLRQAGRALVPVARVDGLGRGERIYAVRFLGDLGYVVTFREVDPLYVIDLTNPLRPKVAGELKIPGYSAYLHPVGEGRLLGVGQDATRDGRVRGLQVSLFDVSDVRHPRRIDRATVSGGHSFAEFDHHAFLWWARTGLAVIPVETWARRDWWSGAVGFRVGAAGIDRIGRISHLDEDLEEDVRRYRSGISRSLVIGDLLYTLSGGGLLASDARTLAERAWVGFPEPDAGPVFIP